MFTGVVNNMWTKDVEIKRGARAGSTASVHLFSLEGDEENAFSLGFGSPNVQLGDEVTFAAEEKFGEMQVNKQTLKIIDRHKKFTRPAVKPKGGDSGGPKNTSNKGYNRGNFPLDFNDGQRSIIRQHAFTQASALHQKYYYVKEGATCDMEELAEIVDACIKLAYKIEMYTSGDDLRNELKDDDDDE